MNNKNNMEDFKRYMKNNSNPWRNPYAGTTMRMVNQPEIVEFIKRNPGKTENQIMQELYGYDRNNTWESNKKYAECLRRALGAGSIRREEKTKNRFVYFIK